MNRKIMIELIIYAVAVIVGLILLFTSNTVIGQAICQ